LVKSTYKKEIIMKKLLALVLVLGIASMSMAAVGATISLVGPAEGEKGSATNPLLPSETCVIMVVSDAPILSLDAIVSLQGLASITGATDVATGVAKHGWDAGFAADTAMTARSATFAAGNFNGLGGAGKVLAEIVVHCDGEDLVPVVVDIIGNDQLGGSVNIDGLSLAAFSDVSALVYQIPEPMTMSLLGMGALALIRRRRA
jgi:hypothetical protein